MVNFLLQDGNCPPVGRDLHAAVAGEEHLRADRFQSADRACVRGIFVRAGDGRVFRRYRSEKRFHALEIVAVVGDLQEIIRPLAERRELPQPLGERVSGEQEPITPFTLQAGNLYQKQGISIILVVGSSGSYFYIADHVLQMDNYRTYDITKKVKTVIGEKSETGEKKVPVDVDVLFDKDHHRSLKAGKMEKKRDQVKIKQFGKDSFSIGRENVDLKYVEQILDTEQTTALAYCLKNLLEEMERKEQDVDLCVEKLWSQIKKQGLASLCKGSYLSVSMAQIRKQDIYACLNGYRGFIR